MSGFDRSAAPGPSCFFPLFSANTGTCAIQFARVSYFERPAATDPYDLRSHAAATRSIPIFSIDTALRALLRGSYGIGILRFERSSVLS